MPRGGVHEVKYGGLISSIIILSPLTFRIFLFNSRREIEIIRSLAICSPRKVSFRKGNFGCRADFLWFCFPRFDQAKSAALL
jgi:hypothetical protein